jgi:hypothetical protein
MKNNCSSHYYIIVILLAGIINNAWAQKAIPASGGNASGSGGSVSYTLGQVVFTTNSSSFGSVSQGVQQPYEISVTTSLEEAEDIILVFLAYPNPVSDLLYLKVESFENDSFSYKLFDSGGKLLESKKVSGTINTISMTNLVPSVYFLKVLRGSIGVKTFRIIKN